MALKTHCPHKEKCPVYQGKTIEEKDKLVLHKNVFCNRGYRGWKNCNEYLLFENTGHSSNKTDKN